MTHISWMHMNGFIHSTGSIRIIIISTNFGGQSRKRNALVYVTLFCFFIPFPIRYFRFFLVPSSFLIRYLSFHYHCVKTLWCRWVLPAPVRSPETRSCDHIIMNEIRQLYTRPMFAAKDSSSKKWTRSTNDRVPQRTTTAAAFSAELITHAV